MTVTFDPEQVRQLAIVEQSLKTVTKALGETNNCYKDLDKKLDKLRINFTKCHSQRAACHDDVCSLVKKVELLEKRRWVSRSLSALGGFVGGFVAVGTYLLFRFLTAH